MKLIIYVFIIIISLFSCNHIKENNKNEQLNFNVEEIIPYPYQYLSSDSIDFTIELYEIEEKLFSTLDSVIQIKDKCPKQYRYKDEFIFSCHYHKTDSIFHVSLEYLDNNNFDYTWCNGVFFYKNYQFNYIGSFLNGFFRKNNQKITLRIVDPKKIMIDIDDSGLYWKYILINNKLKNIGYKNCDGWWYDKLYNIP